MKSKTDTATACIVCGEVIIINEGEEITKYCSDVCEEAAYNPLGKEYKNDTKRKEAPVYSGVLKYFPKTLMALARCSKAGNDQHNPGKELHWDRSKSSDHLDSMIRHVLEVGSIDTDGIPHSVKVVWRAMANCEEELEDNER